MFIIKIFYGLIFLFLGIAMLKYRKTVYEWTGRFAWAERYIGSGGTIVVIMLVGLLLIFLSVAYPFGLIDLSSNQKELNDYQERKLEEAK